MSLAGYATAFFPARRARRKPLSPCGRGWRGERSEAEPGEGCFSFGLIPLTRLADYVRAAPSPNRPRVFPSSANHKLCEVGNIRLRVGEGKSATGASCDSLERMPR